MNQHNTYEYYANLYAPVFLAVIFFGMGTAAYFFGSAELLYVITFSTSCLLAIVGLHRAFEQKNDVTVKDQAEIRFSTKQKLSILEHLFL